MAKRRKPKPVTVRHADGRVELVKAKRFQHDHKSRKIKYKEYLRSPEWKALRKKALARDEHCCAVCRSDRKLEVHHRTYERIFHEDLDDLMTFCQHCHSTVHWWRKVRSAA